MGWPYFISEAAKRSWLYLVQLDLSAVLRETLTGVIEREIAIQLHKAVVANTVSAFCSDIRKSILGIS